MNRLTDVANIYGSIAGAMPGAPTQKFTPNPVVSGIGGFANMYQTLGGMGGGAPVAPPRSTYLPPNVSPTGSDIYGTPF
jgi:hypothetical protein